MSIFAILNHPLWFTVVIMYLLALDMSNAAGYMENSMYLNMCNAAGYMEISMYLAMS